MTKLELIAELLTEELHTFKTEVDRLEKVDKNLRDVRIKADSTKIEQLIERYLCEQGKRDDSLLSRIEQIESKVRAARTIPNWLIINVLILFLSMAFVIVYLLIVKG